MLPNKFFLTCGSGRDEDPIISFGLALKEAGITQFNLVKVSSIIPPKCNLIPKEEGLNFLSTGQVVHCVLARQNTNADELISASIGVAFPWDKDKPGCIYELTGVGKSKATLGREAEKLARSLLSKTLDLEPYKSLNISCEAIGITHIYTTVIAAAVFVRE
ncbi:MAG: arginine decarboxylase, pyruvoyl-dependent [Candidatus Methanomethyliaceae archaeon]|nr:arginine decarboxylase, pyruvoyl-dependent [Candidatus Methanomethyliaceae archaeon]